MGLGSTGSLAPGIRRLAGATVAIQPDGRIVTAGSRSSGSFASTGISQRRPAPSLRHHEWFPIGRASTIQGMVPGDRAGVHVQIVGRPCYGFGAFRPLAAATTGPRGTRDARVRPGSQDQFSEHRRGDHRTARCEGSPEGRPEASLEGPPNTRVIAGRSLTGEIAVLQRRAGNRWVSSKRPCFGGSGSAARRLSRGEPSGPRALLNAACASSIPSWAGRVLSAAASKPIRG